MVFFRVIHARRICKGRFTSYPDPNRVSIDTSNASIFYFLLRPKHPIFFSTFFSSLCKPYFPHASPYIFLQYEWECLLNDQSILSLVLPHDLFFSFNLDPFPRGHHLPFKAWATPCQVFRRVIYRFPLTTVSQSEQVTIFISGGCDLVNTATLAGKESERKIDWISSLMRCDTY